MKFRLIRLIIGIIPMFYGLSDYAMVHNHFLIRAALVFVGAYITFGIISRSNK